MHVNNWFVILCSLMCWKIFALLFLTALISCSNSRKIHFKQSKHVRIEVVTDEPEQLDRDFVTEYDVKVFWRMLTERINLRPTPPHPGLIFIWWMMMKMRNTRKKTYLWIVALAMINVTIYQYFIEPKIKNYPFHIPTWRQLKFKNEGSSKKYVEIKYFKL